MLKQRLIAAVIAALGAGVAYAQTTPMPDVRREERMEDRRLDRQEDRQADRQQDRRMEVENEAQEERNEHNARLAVPRTTAGAIDLNALSTQITDLLKGGARDIRINERGLTAAERQQIDALAQQLTMGLDNVRIRQNDNRLRIDVRHDRGVRGERQAMAQRQDRVQRMERPERVERAERAERPERVERPDRPDRSGRH